MTQPDGEQASMTPRDYFLYAVMVFGWSTSWIMLKQQLGVVAPEVSPFWRYLAAALLMFSLSAVLKAAALAAHDHLRFLQLGLCLFSANFLLFYYAGSYGASGLLAVVFSTASLIIVLMVALISRQMLKWMHLLAAVIGISGVLLLYLPELRASETALVSLGLCLAGTLLFSTGNLVSAATQRAGLPVMGASMGNGLWYGVAGIVCIGQWQPVHHRVHACLFAVTCVAGCHLVGDYLCLLSHAGWPDWAGPGRLCHGDVSGLCPADFNRL